MQYSENSFGGEKPVGNHANKKRRDHCTDGRRAVRQTNLLTAKAQRGIQVSSHGDVPHTPDAVLKKHHDPETNKHRFTHCRCLTLQVVLFLYIEIRKIKI